MSDAQRELDAVVFGATGFVGALTADHLAAHAPLDARIGLAGRDEVRLRRLRDRLGERAADWPLIVADVDRPETLQQLADRTTAVATTVGPYVRYGEPLVAACASAGTHYADLTGEVMFVRRMIDRHHQEASDRGARIINAAGFDSIPSDIGVLELANAARDADAGELAETELVVTDLRGGISGGTLASMTEQLAAIRRDPAARGLVADPYSLSPDREAEPDRTHPGWPSERDAVSLRHDPLTGRWLAPFIMAAYNTRVVRRSNALLGHRYGREFRYREALGLGSGGIGLAVATAATLGTGLLAGSMLFGPTRRLVGRLGPKPGEGPSEQVQANGRFRCELAAVTSSGRRVTGIMGASGDPGYAATAVMLGESLLALALDGGRLPDVAGVLTPATGIGTALSDRLRKRGFTITAQAGF